MARIPECETLVDNIRYHHKNYDGTGYPAGDFQGEDIPLGARIIAVADAFDAMTSDRVYRLAMTEQAACQELIRCSGTQFDPQIVRIFVDWIKETKLKDERLMVS